MSMRRTCLFLFGLMLSIALPFYFQEISPPAPPRSIFDSLPLRTDAREIRLLVLLPGKREQPVNCTLSVASLDGDLVYEALSYTWGDQAALDPIWLNGQSFPVATNLHGALVQLRDGSAPRTLWVDAVCINQGDLAELGEQVQHMRSIYQKASEVLVWLGETSEDSDLAMDLVTRVSSGDRVGLEDTEPGSPDNELARGALNALFNRPWWTRLWVIQEFAVARTAPLIGCGDRWLRSDCLPEFLNKVETRFGYHRERTIHGEDFKAVRSLLTFRETVSKGLSLGLVQVLSQTRRTSSSTRIHDLVYALFGLVDADYRAGINVDYLKPVERLFTDIATQCIGVDGNLDVLYGAFGHGNLDLPSWVPDWSVNRSSSILYNNREGRHRASADMQTSPRYSQDGRILTVDGLKIDSILEVDHQPCSSDFHRGALRVEDFVSTLAATHFSNNRQVAFREELVTDCVLAEFAIKFFLYDNDIPVMESYEEYLRDFVLEHLHGMLHFSREPYPSERLRREFDLALWYTIAPGYLFVTADGYLGVATDPIEVGDVLAVLFGGSMPFILRRVENHEEQYKLVGSAVVHGLMEGQAIKAMGEPSPIGSKAQFSII